MKSAFLNGKPIKVSSVSDLGKATVGCDWGWSEEGRRNVYSWLGKIFIATRQIKSMGSAVLDLGRVAHGELDAYFHSGLKPWDVAASSLFIQKAGGKITTADGSPWNIFEKDIIASNGSIHDQLLNLIEK